MKKLLIGLFTLSFLFTGCTKKTTTTEENTDTGNKTTETTTTSTFASFETALKEAGIEVKEKAENLAEKIGAKEGYRYHTDQGYIEAYYFEDEEALKNISKTNSVTADGVEYPVMVNGNWVLFTNDLAYKDNVTTIFNNMK